MISTCRLIQAVLFRLVVAILWGAGLGVPGGGMAQDQASPVAGESASDVAFFLRTGQLEQGERTLRSSLESDPSNDQLRMELGIVKFFQAVEGLGQSFYRAGLRSDFALAGMPLFRLSVPSNPRPEKFRYEDWEATLELFSRRLAECEGELARVGAGEVAVVLKPMEIHLDFNADGTADQQESLEPVLEQLLGINRNRVRNNGQANRQRGGGELEIRFDRADVIWLRAYCCLLRAICETGLAYDARLFWDVYAHRIFAAAEVKFRFADGDQNNQFFDVDEILDLVAGIHNLQFRLKRPERLRTAHELLLQTVALSREMWQAIQEETDNDREWIPSPSQQSAVSPVQISDEMVATWDQFLDEAEALLKGDVLLPFWRGNQADRGINLKKVFTEPRDADVILWIHGSQAVPYLERGAVTAPDTWTRFQRVFRGQFFGFAVWIN